MTDLRTLLRSATGALRAQGSPSPRLDAEVLLMHFLKIDRTALLLHPERKLSEEEEERYAAMVERRRCGEPVAYITGFKEFWSLAFSVSPAVLIPRPETECLVEEALARCGGKPCLRICDIGTGSGAIAVALARELPQAQVVATDLSQAALATARDNALRHGVADRITFLWGDLFAGGNGPFDLICSNPPYIPETFYPRLPVGIRAFEPRSALVAGSKGTEVHRRIIRESADRLVAGGWLLLEIGEGQGETVTALFRETEFYDMICLRTDYGGLDRVATAKRQEG